MKPHVSPIVRSVTALALLTLAACVSKTSAPEVGTNSPAPAAGPRVVYLKEGDRLPAQAPQITWVPAAVVMDVQGSKAAATASVTVNRDMMWFEDQAFQDTRMDDQDVLVPDTCYDLVCSGGNGQSELWNQFYGAKGSAKANALAIAIKGIGASSAQSLVQAGYFHSKPRSWQDFAAEINRAAESGVIQKSVATQVIYTYRADNAANLGYGAGSCVDQARACSVWQRQLVAVPFVNHRQVEQHKTVAQRRYDVAIQATGAKLLSTERERVGFRIDENGQVLEREINGDYNHYAVATAPAGAGQVSVQLRADRRLLRDLPSNMIRQSNFTLVNKVMTWVVDIDPGAIPTDEDPNSQLVADYKVKACDLNWLGACKMTAKYNDLKVGSQLLKEPRTVVTIDLPGSKQKVWIEYSLSRRNSQFFNDQAVPQTQTSAIKR